MLGTGEMTEFYRTNFLLIKEHNFALSEIEAMLPYEREIYVALVIDYINKKNQEKKASNPFA